MRCDMVEVPLSRDRKLTVAVEHFGSAEELVNVCRQRPFLCRDEDRNKDFFSPSAWGRMQFNNFTDPQDLYHRLRNGSDDLNVVHNISAYAYQATCKTQEKLTQRSLRVAGGAVNVARYLQGVPECMWTMTRKTVRSKIINIAVNMAVSAYADKDDFTEVGKAICKTVAKLEKAGYRIRLHAVLGDYMGGGRGARDNNAIMMDLILKRENESMNYRRIVYALTDISFFRGAGFGWICRCPDVYPRISGLGQTIECVCGCEDNESDVLDELYSKAVGRDCVRFDVPSLIDRIRPVRGESKADADKRIEKELEAACLSV